MFVALAKTLRLDAKHVRAKSQFGIISELYKPPESSGSLTRTRRLAADAEANNPAGSRFHRALPHSLCTSRNILKIRFPAFADLLFSAYLAASLSLPPRSFSTAKYAASLSAG